MKAITKDGRKFDVKFAKLDIYDFYWDARKSQWWQNLAKICIDGEWLYGTIEAFHDDAKVEKAIISLSCEAKKALGLNPSPNKHIAIFLDKIPKEEWNDFYNATENSFKKEAENAQFTTLKIQHNNIVDWDCILKKEYASLNEKAQEMLLAFSLACEADRDAMSEYIIPGDGIDSYFFTYTITKDDMERINRIAEPERKKYEERKKHEAWLEARRQEKEKNVADGAIYFHCESAPHDEDLTNVILARPCPNGGSFTLTHRIDKEVFDKIKEYGVYYSDDFLEECDMFTSAPGWRFTYHAIDVLRKLGYRVFVDY